MKKFIFTLLTVSIFTAGCTQEVQSDQKVESQETGYFNVSAKDFKAALTSSPGILIDVRTPGEFANGYIDGAINIDIYDPEFNTKINELDKSKTIYIYCASGGRSAQGGQLLIEEGFKKVVNLNGGFSSWE